MSKKHSCNTKIGSSILILLVICGGFLPLIGQCSSQFFPIHAYHDNYGEKNTWNQASLLENYYSTYPASSTEVINYTISIHSNDDLYDLKLQGAITGEGTEGNPYVLENLVIDTDFSGSAIAIRDTDAYLVIRNCTVLNSGIPDEEDAGIYIRSCSNITIVNCTLYNNDRAIAADNDSLDITIINNLILHSDSFGITVSGLQKKVLNNVLMYTNGVAIELWQAENNSVTGNIMIDNNEGISVAYSNSNIISENEITGSFMGEDGISLTFSNENNITMNRIINNHHGIYLISSNGSIIYFNIIYGNSDTQAFENEGCTDNQWDNGTTGNYWGNDYIIKYPDATNDGTFWDTPYEIDGEGLGIDHFPLIDLIFPDINAPKFTDVPVDFSDDEGYSGLSIFWIAVDLYPATYTIELNETEVVPATAWTSQTTILYDIPDGLLEEDYNIKIIISDESGYTAQDTVIFTVIYILRYESPIGSYPWLWLSMLSITSIAIVIAIQRKKRTQTHI